MVVCPTTLNAASMLVGLLKATYQEVLKPSLIEKFKVVLTKMVIMEDFHTSFRWRTNLGNAAKKDLMPYKSCFEINTDAAEHCDLILVLSALLEKYSYTDTQRIIVTYAVDAFLYPDTSDLIEYMTERNFLNHSSIHEASPANLVTQRGVLAVYLTFYEVVHRNRTGQTVLLKPQGLNAYFTGLSEIQLTTGSEFGLFLAGVLNGYSKLSIIGKTPYNPVFEFYSLVAQTWAESLKVYLKVSTHHEATLLMNSFWHAGLKTDLFQPSAIKGSNKYMCMPSEDGEFNHLDQVCSETIKEDQSCTEYCELMSKVCVGTQNRVQEVLKMGLDSPVPLMGIFQTCQYPKVGSFDAQNCWKMVINDKGVCYTSRGDGKQT